MSLTAANADVWLPVRPGTEGVLARGIAGVLIAEGAVGADSLAAYTGLFPGAAPSLEETAAACDVSAERIQTVARDLAAAEGRVVVGGGSAAAHSNGLFNVTAALGLNVLLGNLGQPGGVFAPSRAGLAAAVTPPDVGTTPAVELAARLRGESGTPVRALIVMEADPVHTLPAGWGVEAALANVQTIVALSSFRDDTTLHADLVLPVHTEFERFNAVEPGTAVGARAISITQPVVEPMGDAFHPADVILAIAASVGGTVAAAFPWASVEAMTRARLGELQAELPGGAGADPATYYFDALARGGVFEEGVTASAPPGPTGAAPESTESRPDGDASFPFTLLPHESLKMGDGRGANRPWLQEMPDPLSTVMWQSWAELAPSDAAELGVADGDRIRIESAAGAVEVPAVIDPAVRPGIVGMPTGHGHRDYGRYAIQRGCNPMHLVGGLQVDGTTASAWAATRVRITRVGPGPLARFGRSYETLGAAEEIPVGWAPMDTSIGRPA